MHYKFEAMHPKTRFGKWLYLQMVERDLNCTEVANRLHVTKQIVAMHIGGHHLPNYPFVVAYCMIFGGNPEGIWKLVESDKEGP